MGGNPAFSEWMVRNISILLRQIGNIIVGHCEPIEKHLQAPGRSLTNPMNPAEYTFTGGSINTDKYYLKYLKYKKKYLQLKNINY